MRYDIWLKLVIYELATKHSRQIKWVEGRVKEYADAIGELPIHGDILYRSHANNKAPDVLADEIYNYFKEQDRKREEKEERDRKASQEKMSKRFKKIIEEIKNQPLEPKPAESLEFQLGLYIGEYIVERYLPTLSTDGITTINCIEVSAEDTAEEKRLSDAHDAARHPGGKTLPTAIENGLGKVEWDAYIKFRQSLDIKYLPPVIECYVHRLSNVSDTLDKVKNGIRVSLWDCDCCSYDIDNIEIVTDEESCFSRSTTIKLYLKP